MVIVIFLLQFYDRSVPVSSLRWRRHGMWRGISKIKNYFLRNLQLQCKDKEKKSIYEKIQIA